MHFAVIAEFILKPGQRDKFYQASLSNAATSAQSEPGCRQFDVLKATEDENKVTLYEIYDNTAAFEAHTKTPHFEKWKAAIAGTVEKAIVNKYMVQQNFSK